MQFAPLQVCKSRFRQYTQESMSGEVRILGVSTAGATAFLALMNADRDIEPGAVRIDGVADLSRAADIGATRDLIRHRLEEQRPTVVVVLSAEATAKPSRDRSVIETLILLGSLDAGIPAVCISRPTVRATLGLSKKGALANCVQQRIPLAHGAYWANRGLAALAALAYMEEPNGPPR